MQSFWTSLRFPTLPHYVIRLTHEQWAILITSQVMAFMWWGAVLMLYLQIPNGFWSDQSGIFLQVVHNLDNPYIDHRFVNPLWTAAFLAPLGLMPVPLAAFIQTWIYFSALAVFIIRFEGTRRTALVVFTSYIAFDSCLQLNLEWLVALGLLVPLPYALPFLLVKPQTALGYMLAYVTRPKILAHSVLVMLALLLVTLAIWGFWPQQWYDQTRWVEGIPHNIAPAHLLPRLLSYALGLPLAIGAVRRSDPVLGILAWVFFAPYYTAYGALILLTCLALKLKSQPLIVHIGLWLLALIPGVYLIITLRMG